ncbi:MAG: hypothetical protein PVI07_17470 [Anaerolineae bacterium]|jgi:hypothetical protein
MEQPTPEEVTSQVPTEPQPAVSADVQSPAEQRARRWFIIGASIAGLLLIGLIVLMVFLSISAYQATVNEVGPSPGSVVVGLLRDAAIIFVAFETLLIGLLVIVLALQIQSLTVLLRDEITPMLEAANETMRTVRGTTKFVSHNVVSPVMKWSGYLAGVRRIFSEIAGLRRSDDGS